MKKLILSILLITGILQSCTKDFDTLNINTKQPSSVEPSTLFASASRSYGRFLASPNVNFNIWRLISQYWTETTYTDESNYDLSTRNIPRNVWDALYRDVLKDLDEAAKLVPSTTATGDEKKSQLAQIQILKALAFYTLVNTFGNVPYSDALNIANPKPSYDSGAAIYNDLILKLNSAISDLENSSEGFGTSDIIYNADNSKWIKFANVIKLRIGINLADVDNAAGKSIVESAVSKGIFTSNDDNATFKFTAVNPNSNPVWEDLVLSGRKDFVIAKTFVDKLNQLNDPRRSAYMKQVDAGGFVGGVYGASNNYSAFSQCADWFTVPEREVIIADYSEVCFLLAEAAERGFSVGGTAESYYNEGIKANFEYYNVGGVDNYLATPDVKYTTAAGSWKEKIGVQSWIALYNRGHESWTSWRRLDFPALVAPSTARSPIPVRYPYSVDEQTLNKANWEAASTAIGGDVVTTKLFWDKF